jgi:hypothetical protein
MPVNHFEEYTIDDAIREDKPGLFALADEVVRAAPTRKWDLWVSDANRAYFLTQFLGDVCTGSGIEIPPIIHIAASRSVRKYPEHQEAIAHRLARTGIADGKALILSEYTSSWHGIAMLDRHLRQSGAIAVDAAILNVGKPNPYVELPARMPDNIYSGQQDADEPGLTFNIMTDAIPQITVAGFAEPLPDPHADLALYNQARDAFTDLAHTYTASHRSS